MSVKAEDRALLEKLRELRKKKDLKPLPPTPLLKTEIVGLDGELQPFSFRYYQIIGIMNMLSLRRMILGDSTGTGKTVQTIGTLCYLWEKKPETKVVVFAPKSAIGQWAGEIERFTNGIKVFMPPGSGGVDARAKVYEDWVKADKGVLILNYALLVRDWNHGCYKPLLPNGRPDPKQPVTPGLLDAVMARVAKNLTVVFDEAAAFKSMQTKTWEIARFLSDRSNRVYGLTATLLKNNLMEGYSIYKAILPSLFTTKTKFYEDYCYVEYQRVARGKVPIIKGYKNLDKFREVIEPVYLGRQKHEISDELPTLTTREVTFELDTAEELKYREALSGLLELGDGDVREFEETKALTSLIYTQQVVNSLALLKFKEGQAVNDWDSPEGHVIKSLSGKEQALVDLLTEELDGEKVIVYTRFESHVARLQAVLKKHKIKSVRITGAEHKAEQRRAAQQAFQDLKSDVRVVFITAAGSEAINLQAASSTIFFDMPWAWGDYVQTLGRMIRIGSPHKGVLCYHLLAERPGSNRKERDTIDHHVLKMLKKKKNLIDKVLGEAAVGALKFEKDSGSIRDLVKSLQKGVAA